MQYCSAALLPINRMTVSSTWHANYSEVRRMHAWLYWATPSLNFQRQWADIIACLCSLLCLCSVKM